MPPGHATRERSASPSPTQGPGHFARPGRCLFPAPSTIAHAERLLTMWRQALELIRRRAGPWRVSSSANRPSTKFPHEAVIINSAGTLCRLLGVVASSPREVQLTLSSWRQRARGKPRQLLAGSRWIPAVCRNATGPCYRKLALIPSFGGFVQRLHRLATQDMPIMPLLGGAYSGIDSASSSSKPKGSVFFSTTTLNADVISDPATDVCGACWRQHRWVPLRRGE